jgi:hypothetical protein
MKLALVRLMHCAGSQTYNLYVAGPVDMHTGRHKWLQRAITIVPGPLENEMFDRWQKSGDTLRTDGLRLEDKRHGVNDLELQYVLDGTPYDTAEVYFGAANRITLVTRDWHAIRGLVRNISDVEFAEIVNIGPQEPKSISV